MRQTSGCGSLLLRALAVVLAAAFMLSLPAAIIAYDLGRVVFSPEVVSQVVIQRLVEGGAFRRVLIAALFGEQAQGSEIAQALSRLSPSEQEEAMAILVPSGWAEDQVARIVSGLYAWVDNARPAPDLSLDLRPLRENLLTGAAADLVELVVDSWPSCTLEQLAEMSQAASTTGEVPVLYCEPSEPFRSLLVQFATEALRDQARQMQTVRPLGQEAAQALGAVDIVALKERLRLLRLLGQGGWMLAASILGLILACAVRSWKELGRWWGIPSIAAGSACLLSALVGGSLAAGALESASSAAGEDLLAGLVPAVLGGILDQVLGRILVHGLLVAVAGGVVLVGGNWLARRTREREPASPLQPVSEAPVTERREARPPDPGDTPSGLFG